MRYAICPDGIPNLRNYIEIDEAQFKSILESRHNEFVALAIEEKMDIALSNYEEFEKDLMDRTLSYMMHPIDLSNRYGMLQSFNRRILNLTASCRLYVDQVVHDLGVVFGKESAEVAGFKAKCSNEYDTNLGYRVMYAARNYMQHKSLPITEFRVDCGVADRQLKPTIKYLMSPKLDVDDLREDGDFKKSVLDEIESSGESADIKRFVRANMDSMGAMHKYIRTSMKQKMLDSQTSLENVHTALQKKFNKEPEFIHVFTFSEEGRISDRIYINPEITKRRQMLEERNAFITSFVRSYVTAEILKGPETFS